MQSNISDSNLHIGHRERMRRKLRTYGGEIFDTYELLEMLLYAIIPVRDTKSIAKRLLAAFGGLDEVLSADVKSLKEIDGVGPTTAEYLVDVGRITAVLSCGGNVSKRLLCDDDVGNFFISYYKGKSEYTVSMLILNNAMRPIKMVDVHNCDYGSGTVRGKAFIDIALANRASAVAIGHNHPYGPLYPNRADILTHKIVAEEFKHSGIDLLDHYLVSGNGYLCIGEMATKADGRDVLLRDYGIVCVKADIADNFITNYRDYFADSSDSDREYLASFLKYLYSPEKADMVAEKLIGMYHNLDGALGRSFDELFDICGSGAMALKVLAFVTSKRFTDKYGKGKKHGQWIGDYFRWKFFGISQENVYIALFDKNEKLISINKLSEGTVNSSEILPRKAMELACQAGAKSVVLAHNHPCGIPVGSQGDVLATKVIYQALDSVGVELKSHLIVADAEIGFIDIDSIDIKQQ